MNQVIPCKFTKNMDREDYLPTKLTRIENLRLREAKVPAVGVGIIS